MPCKFVSISLRTEYGSATFGALHPVVAVRTHPSQMSNRPDRSSDITARIIRATLFMDSTTENSPRRTQGGRSRKKSCVQCAKAKARCNLQRPACRRCVATKKQCKYTTPPEPASPPLTASETASRGSLRASVAAASPGGLSNALIEESVARNQPISASPKVHFATPARGGGDGAHLYHANLDLIPLDDAEQIRHRWMRQFLAAPEQPHKNFHPHTLQYISCVLRVYPKQMAEEDGIPPFIHPMQTTAGGMAVSLANCYSLVRMWHHRAPMSEDVVAEAIQREMARLECLVSLRSPRHTHKDLG